MKLRKYSITGEVMFDKDYIESVANTMLKNNSKYPNGNTHWEVVADKPKEEKKSMGRPKKKRYEDS